MKLNDGPTEAFKNWKGITAQVGVDFPATEINMSAWSEILHGGILKCILLELILIHF